MLDSLPPPPRRHVPAELELASVPALTGCYDELAARPLPPGDRWALAQWLRDWSELESLLNEEQTRREVAMHRRTDDPDLLAAYLDWIDRVAPPCKPLRDRLARRLLAHPDAAALPPERHACMLRALASEVALFRPAIVPLEAAEQRLCAEHQTLRGGMQAEFRGHTCTLEALEAEDEHPDRDRREHAWRTLADRFLAEKPALDDLFDRLLEVRLAQAAAADCHDYRDYRFRKLGRFDYGPADCLALHAAIADAVVPLASELLHARAAALGLPRVRPWDLLAPLPGEAPLHPFTAEAPLIAGCTEVFTAVDPELGRQFAGLAARGLLDLMARPGKAPGGYQVNLEASGLPFIFANLVGRHDDLLTLLHEGGHALHALACADEPLIWNRTPPLEFCEVASMGMELLASDHLHPFYDPATARRARRQQLESIVLFLPYMACVDALQHWLYTHPQQAAGRERDAVWQALHERYFPAVDWSGLEHERAALWQRKLHILELPFYYIEYGIAQLGALQLLANDRRDRPATIAAYRRALALGARAGVRDLFAAAGLRFDLSLAAVTELMQLVRAELAQLA